MTPDERQAERLQRLINELGHFTLKVEDQGESVPKPFRYRAQLLANIDGTNRLLRAETASTADMAARRALENGYAKGKRDE